MVKKPLINEKTQKNMFMNDTVILVFFESVLPVYMTQMMRLITQSFVEVNTSICLMTVMPWRLIVK